MTLEAIASTIRNNVESGLKGVTNVVYSLDQIKHEISNFRSRLIFEYSQKRKLDHYPFSQKRENIKLEIGTFPEEGVIESNNNVFVAKIPKLAMTADNSAILYLGPPDMSLNINLYYTLISLDSHKYTRTIKNRPYGFIDQAQDRDGYYTVYISNIGPAAFKYITVRALFDDPVKIMQEDGWYIDDEEFPAPLAVQDMIIEQLTKKYLTYYKQLSQVNESNDQTDK